MIILKNTHVEDVTLTLKGEDIFLPANKEVEVTEEEAKFVVDTLGFVTKVGEAKAKNRTAEVKVPEVPKEVEEVKEPETTEEVVVEEVKAPKVAKTNNK